MCEGCPRSRERHLARWTARAVVLAVFSFLLVAVLSTAAMAGANPVKVGSVATGKNPYSVCVQGSYAYVVNNSGNTLQVFNVSNPASPTLSGSVATGKNPYSVCVQGSYAYVANYGGDTLQIFNVSNPAAPASVGSAATGTYPASVAVQGDYAYVVNRNSATLQVFNVSNPASPALSGSAATGTVPMSVCVQGGYAYVANEYSNSLQVFNVANPASPSRVGSVGTGTNPYSVSVQGDYAYVVNYASDTLQVFNVSNPAAPTLSGHTSTGLNPYGIFVQNGVAYVVNLDGDTLQVFDVSNPASPSKTGSVGTGEEPNAVYVQNGYAYVVNFVSNTLQVFNVASSTFYFAEGTCRPGFDPYVCIQNPGPADASVMLTYMKGDGTTATDTVTVPKGSRATVSPRTKLGTGNDAAHDFSTTVTCTNGQKIVAERPMYFLYNGVWNGGHNVVGATSPSSTFYFAEGTCRPGFDPYVCLQNPGRSDADVTLTYMKGDGTAGGWVSTGGPGPAGTMISSLSFDSSRNVLYAGLQVPSSGDPNVYRLNVGTGGSWTAIGTLCGGPYIPALEVDESNNNVFAAASNGHVYKDHNASLNDSWVDMGLVETSTVVRSLEFDEHGNKLYSGSSNGAVHSVTLPADATWYLAEGTTAWGFSTYISINNPNGSAVNATVTYMPTGAPNVSESIVLPANSQTTLTNDHIVSMIGDKDFSTKVQATNLTKSLAVDRTMQWTGPGPSGDNTYPEGHSSVGVTAPARTWYLPEGSTDWGFETWLLIQNPGATEASCDVTYMIEGASAKTVNHKVPGRSRESFNVATDIGSEDASIKVSSNVSIIPERAMYRYGRREGHDSIGTTAPATSYYLAEGAVGYPSDYTTYVLVQNPQPDPNDVTVTFLTGTGEVAGPAFEMPANSRKTIRVNDYLPNNKDVSTSVTGTRAIIAERAMYWDSPAGEACHDSIGMSTPATYFFLPDGQTSDGRETWTLIQNANSTAVDVTITYMNPSGTGNVVQTESIPAHSRETFDMAGHSGLTGRASIVVRSDTLDKKIIVERAMYWSDRSAGTDTIGGSSD